MGELRPLLIVDGDNLTHRAYHTMPPRARAKDGTPLNAVQGFFSMLRRIYNEEQPRAVFVAWDTLGVETFRSKLWPQYQGGRVFPEALVAQLDLLPRLCTRLSMGVGKAPGCEADDFMGSAARAEAARGGNALLLTTDKDAYQLVSEHVTMLAPKPRTRELDRITPREVVQRLGVLPEQVPDFKALAGDSSDKIPGIPGIGPKGAASLLLKHGFIEQFLVNDDDPLVRRSKMFKEIATIRCDLVVDLPETAPAWDRLESMLQEL